MNLLIVVPLAGIPVSFACLVAACLVTRRGGWDRAGGLFLAMAVLAFVSSAILPGEATGDEVGDGILAVLWMVQTFWFWVVAASCSLVLYGAARDFADRLSGTGADE